MYKPYEISIVWLLGSISGFTLMISGNTLNYWLATEAIDIRTIGIFAFTVLPYSINFIWAPILDTYKFQSITPFFDLRVSWILVITVFLIIAINSLSFLSPSDSIYYFAIWAFLISFFSSTLDSVLGALKTELISPQNQGKISGVYIFGYRIGMLFSGSLAIYLSSFMSFNLIYKLLALILFLKVSFLVSLITQTTYSGNFNNDNSRSILPKRLIYKLVKLISQSGFVMPILGFLILYRIGDNFINIMINPFLLDVGFEALEIATAGKLFGILNAIIGGFIASYIMKKKGILNSLLIFGLLHALGHSLFIAQDYYGNNLYLFFIVICFESITGGMSMAAYIAFISTLCTGRFRATKYSFFSAMMGLSRAIFPAISGFIVTSFGWKIFFFFTTLISLPSLVLLMSIKKHISLNEDLSL